MALVLTTEVSGDEVAFFRFYDAGRVALREVGLLVEELILDDGGVPCRNVAREVVFARADGLGLAVGQADVGCGVARHFDVPFHVLQRLLPMADNLSVGRDVADVGIAAILDVEGGLQAEPLIGSG